MERILVLQILDEAWKNHLLVMDHLRSSVGLRGYAQVDPKVEYKREGMRTFESMWDSVGQPGDRLCVSHGAAFRGLRRLDLGRQRRPARRGRVRPARSTSSSRRPSTARKPSRSREPIRNRQPQVGRNEPCPCGSGKKYKACHGRRN